MTSIGRTWRRITVARWLACALLAIARRRRRWRNRTISTVVGQAEIVAVAVDESSSTIYYASDRPGAIFKMTGLFGASTLVAGIAGGPIGDGVPASQAAVFPGRNGLAVDTAGNVFFTEPSLHRIRRIDATTGVVTTVAGTGRVNGTDSGGIVGASATFTDLAAPGALAFDPLTGDLFVADEAWDIVYRISSNGHGPITDSNALAFRAVGGDPANVSIYVDFEYYNPFGYAGDNGPAIDAKLNHPRGLAFDNAGNLYIADTGNNVVRRVDTTGTISTIAGTGAPGYAGDGSSSPATSAQLFLPTGVVVDSQGDLFIADTSNQRVRDHGSGIGTDRELPRRRRRALWEQLAGVSNRAGRFQLDHGDRGGLAEPIHPGPRRRHERGDRARRRRQRSGLCRRRRARRRRAEPAAVGRLRSRRQHVLLRFRQRARPSQGRLDRGADHGRRQRRSGIRR